MSLLLKNELRLRLGAQGCAAEVWRAGWARRPAAEVRVQGSDGAQLEQALDALLDQGQALPRKATICVGDEFLYFAVLPAEGSWQHAQAQAEACFADSLGGDERLVTLQLSPDGGQWLAVAVDAALVDGWRQTLATQGVTLSGLRPGLFEDLWRWQLAWPLDDALIVLMRDQGVMCLGVLAGAVHSIAWERCDVSQPELWCARVQACAERLSAAREDGDDGEAGSTVPVVLVPEHEAEAAALQMLSPMLGWQVLSRAATPS